jgi:hypothetical protein
VFYAPEALFLRGRHQPAIRDEGRRGITVVGIDAKNENHPTIAQ